MHWRYSCPGTQSCPQSLVEPGCCGEMLSCCHRPWRGNPQAYLPLLQEASPSLHLSRYSCCGGLVLPLNLCFRGVGEGPLPPWPASFSPGLPLGCRKAVGPVTGSDHWHLCLDLVQALRGTGLTGFHSYDIPCVPNQICHSAFPMPGLRQKPVRVDGWVGH